MKLLALICLFGLAAASAPTWQWQSGKEHTFEYSGRMLTGIPGLAPQYSGIGIKAVVALQVKSLDDLRLTLRNVQFTKVNTELTAPVNSGVEGFNWRNLVLPAFEPVTAELKTLLETPVVFSVRDGEIKSLIVSGSELEWSLNFKKALVVLFQTKMERSALDLELNTISKESYETKNFWKVLEQTIEGICEVTYQINELPEYMVKERIEMFPKMEECKTSKFFEIVKTKDIASCKKSSIWKFIKPSVHTISGSIPESFTKVYGPMSSMTRFYACGPRTNMLIQSIVNEGELSQNVMGVSTEKTITGVKQVLKLLTVVPVKTFVPVPPQPRTIESLMYEYMPTGKTLRSEIGLTPKIPQSELTNAEIYKYLPRHFLPSVSSVETKKELSPEKVIVGVKYILEKVMYELIHVEDLHEKEIPMKLMTAVRGMTLLKVEELKTLYTELKAKYTAEETKTMFQNIFFDSVSIAGTTPAILFIKDMIKTEEMTPFQATTIFMLLPHHIMTPSKEVFVSLMELIESEVIMKRPLVHNAAVLSLSNLVQKACIEEGRKISYPVEIFGEFCDPQSEIVIGKWIPYLAKKLKTAETPEKLHLYVVALGLLGHKDVIPILLPTIEGFGVELPESRPIEFPIKNITRELAILSLYESGYKHPELVLPVAYSIFANPAENTQIRLMALDLIMHVNPPMEYIERIVALTWYEKNIEVLRYINTAFHSLAYTTEISMTETATPRTSIVKKIRILLPLMKKIPGVIGSSGRIYTAEYLPKLNAGYKKIIEWMGDRSSVIPSHFYTTAQVFLNGYEFRPYDLAFKVYGSENIYQKLSELLTPVRSVSEGSEVRHNYRTSSRTYRTEESSSMPTLDETFSGIKSQLHSEWVKVIETLKIETRRSGPLSGYMWMDFFEDVSLFASFSDITNELIHEKITPLLTNPKSVLKTVCGEHIINFQRVMNLAPAEALIPSEMGFPIIIEAHMPVALSVRGKLAVKCDVTAPVISLDARFASTANYHVLVGTYSPFTKEMVATGVKNEMVFNLPAKTHIGFEPMTGKVKVVLKPITMTPKPVDILYFSVKPFTVASNLYNLKPLTLSPELKIIKTTAPLRKVEYPFGTPLGLSFNSIVETESRYLDMKYLLDLLKIYKYNPLNLIRFIFVNPTVSEYGLPSLRQHIYRLQFDPTTSDTKAIEMSLDIGIASKLPKEEPLYHTIRVKSLEELRTEPSILKKLIPYGIESLPLTQSVHPARQEILKKVIEKLQLVSGYALNVKFMTILQGPRPRTITYEMTVGTGKDVTMNSKWKIELESEPRSSTMNTKICIDGHVHLPNIPTWDLSMIRSTSMAVEFKNVIGFGKTCEESMIKVIGVSKVSEKQKKLSLESPVAKECQRLISLQTPGAMISVPCQETLRLAKTLDEVDIKVQYVNTPVIVKTLEFKLTQGLKALLWPYLRTNYDYVLGLPLTTESREVGIRMVFDKTIDVLDVKITKPEEVIVFNNIRLPYGISLITPLVLGESNIVLPVQKMTGFTALPKCHIEKNWLLTFDSKHMPLTLDDCFHMIAGDCSSTYSFGVLARSMSKSSESKELKIFLNKTEVLITPSKSYSRYIRDIKLFINGTEVVLMKNTKKVIHEGPTEVLATLYKSLDSVIHFEAPYYGLSFKFDGERISIESTQFLKNKLCGICGDLNLQTLADIRGPRKCVYSKPELTIASYRIPEPHCSPLVTPVKELLETETRKCALYKEYPTEVLKSFMSMVGKCTRVQHMVIERAEEICFSRFPLIQCGPQCHPKPSKLISKKISFTCLPRGRVADLYREKVVSGIELPELKSKVESFSTSILVPQSCATISSSYISSLGYPLTHEMSSSLPVPVKTPVVPEW